MNWSNARVIPSTLTPKLIFSESCKTSGEPDFTSEIAASRREYASLPTLAIF